MPAPLSAEHAARIFGDRLTISRREAARALGVGRDYLDALIAEELIGYVAHGRRGIRFRIEDLAGYLARPRVPKAYQRQGERRCPSTSPRAARATSTTSAAAVTDIAEVRARRAAAKPKPSSAS